MGMVQGSRLTPFGAKRKDETMIFKFHTYYTFAQITSIAAPRLPIRPGLIAGLANHVSVIGPDYEQYDFTGVDEDHLVLVLLDDDALAGWQEALAEQKR